MHQNVCQAITFGIHRKSIVHSVTWSQITCRIWKGNHVFSLNHCTPSVVVVVVDVETNICRIRKYRSTEEETLANDVPSTFFYSFFHYSTRWTINYMLTLRLGHVTLEILYESVHIHIFVMQILAEIYSDLVQRHLIRFSEYSIRFLG